MKKVLLALLMAVAGYAHAVSTNTPTVTPTFTPTFTPTPTRTNTPVAGLGNGTGRVIVQASAFTLTDGITRPGTSSLPGGSDIWLAQVLSGTAALFSTGTASARIQITVPADYMRSGGLWLHAYNSTLTNTVTVEADISKMRLGQLTSTAQVYTGPATNVQTQFTGPLFNARFSRVWVPLSNTVGTYGVLQPGDLLNINIIRTGTSGNLNVFAAEFEYAVNYPLRP